MTTKLKLISISLALFLIVALSAALVFALPKEEFNLSGSLSYQVQYKKFIPIRQAYGASISSSSCAKLHQNGLLELEVNMEFFNTMEAVSYVVVAKKDGNNVEAIGEKLNLSPIFAKEEPLATSGLVGDMGLLEQCWFANENVLIVRFGDLAFAFISEDAPEGEVLYVSKLLDRGHGFYYPYYALRMNVQETNLEGAELLSKLNGQLCAIYSNHYEEIDLSTVEFEDFDQTEEGIKNVQISFPEPSNSENIITAEIPILVGEQTNQASFETSLDYLVFSNVKTQEEAISSINAKLTETGASLTYISADKQQEEIREITSEMVKEFELFDDFGYVKIAHKDAELVLPFNLCNPTDEITVYFSRETLPLPYLVEKGTNGEDFISNEMIDEGTMYLSTTGEDLLIENISGYKCFVDGVETPASQLFLTPGLKKYQIKLVLNDDGRVVNFLNMQTYVYDDENKIVTDFEADWTKSPIEINQDGTLNLEGKYIFLYYNNASTEGGAEGVDYIKIPATDESVEIEYYVQNGIVKLIDVYVNIEVLEGCTIKQSVFLPY